MRSKGGQIKLKKKSDHNLNILSKNDSSCVW